MACTHPNGRRAVTIGALVRTSPAMLLVAQLTGTIAFISGALPGLNAASTTPLMLVMAQHLMIGRAGMASRIILGLGFVMAAIGVPVTGMLADAEGIPATIQAQVIVVVATIVLAWLLPS